MPWNQDLLKSTLDFAARAHGAQLGSGAPYVVHLLKVATEVLHADDGTFDVNFAMQCALLHDCVEDTEVTVEQLTTSFGPGVARAVLQCEAMSNLPSPHTTKLRVGVLGATGMVGQRFLSLLEHHPWFQVTTLAASPASAGKTYAEAVAGRWVLPQALGANVSSLVVRNASDVGVISREVDLVFCAVDMPRDATAALEEAYAKAEVPVMSNNSAHRWTADVPMMVPELNDDHSAVIEAQRRRLGTRRGFIAVKPNCSIQSYVPALHPLRHFGLTKISVCTYQAVSGAGKTLGSWPEMVDNVIPFIKGEEEKSEQEPLKIWGQLRDGHLVPASAPTISAQCIRVPVSDGHLAAVSVAFANKPSREEILSAWRGFEGAPQRLNLPSAPRPFLVYLEDEARPQTRLDRDQGQGQAVSLGRLRPDSLFDWRFIALSHNTVRGAAGGAVLTAELLAAQGWIVPQ